jgi:hypothetical protein
VEFNNHSQQLYGKNFASFNVHSLVHLPREVRYHEAPLDHFSAFRGESAFGPMLKLITSSANNLPAEQLVKDCGKKGWERKHYHLEVQRTTC